MSKDSPRREVMIEDVIEMAVLMGKSCADARWRVTGSAEKGILTSQARMLYAFVDGARGMLEASMVPQRDADRELMMMDIAIAAVKRTLRRK